MKSQNQNIEKLKKLLNKKGLIIGGVVLLVAVVSALVVFGTGQKQPPKVKAKPVVKETLPISLLTGLEVKPEVLERRPIAVTIENYWEARPQSGIDKADVVYEILAEGGITRLLAIYQQNDAAEIGPVRSARPYFLQRVLEYDPMFAHVGGTPQALNDVAKFKIPDLNEMYLGTVVFWRAKDRAAPHNTYTSTEKMRQYGKDKGYEQKVNVPGFVFLQKGEENKNGTDAKKVNIAYSARENKVIYEYDAANKRYNRSHVTGVHMDKVTNKQLTAQNILIQFVPYTVIEPVKGYLSMQMNGQGKAMLVTQGKVYQGKWSKKGDRDKTYFTDDAGQEFKLNPGQTWIQVVPAENMVSIE